MFFIFKINILHVNNSRRNNTRAGFTLPQTSDSITVNKH